MKLKFKSLQGSSFNLDVEPTDTIAAVKGKLEAEYGHQSSSQKLIYSGKILTDADTVQSCGVSEKDFLVLMVSKPKAAKATPAAAAASNAASSEASKAPTEPAPAPASAPAPPPASASIEPTTSLSNSAVPAQAATGASAGPPGTSQFLVGAALEEAVNNIVDMGFEKSEVQKAMRASFNNPERAVEYLMTGIPDHLSPPQAAPQPPSSPQAPTQASGTIASSNAPPAAAATAAPTPAATNTRAGNLFEAAAAAQAQGGGQGGRGGGASDLAGLPGVEDDGMGRSVLDLGNPAMLAQLRQLVQQNPSALNPLVQALAQSNPRLANAMADDPEGVLNLLAGGAAGGGDGEGDEGLTLPAMDELNPEDRTAVEQIIAMGIPEQKAIEAYLMCGRNVEMAVQYYFENPQDFDD